MTERDRALMQRAIEAVQVMQYCADAKLCTECLWYEKKDCRKLAGRLVKDLQGRLKEEGVNG